MKFKPTVFFVVVFIMLLLLAAYSARAEDGARISLGHTVVNSHMTVGELSYEHKNWEFAVAQIGKGDTRNGAQNVVPAYSMSYLTRPHWRFLGGKNYYRLGVAHVDGSPLIGNTNFRLGIGLEYKVFQIEYFHYSSAGIHRPNTGIDGVQLRFKM